MGEKVYGLLGRKLGHSWSAPIHAALGCADYRLIELEPEELGAFLAREDIGGLNVTIPYKRDVMAYCDVLDPMAEAIGSVNTLVRRADGKLYGYNTDAAGFCFMAQRAGIGFAGRKTLVLGSGGASRTAAACAKKLGAREVVVISRSGENNYTNLGRHADAERIVNTTPVGMYPNNGAAVVDLTAFPACAGVLDLIYNPLRTALLLQAEALGIPHGGGLSMLAAQAAASASLFLGGTAIEPDKIRQAEDELRRQTENIVLIGMPGSGKSTIAALLAERLHRPVLDSDAQVVETAGMSIPDIFAAGGEDAFRARETAALAELGKRSGAVLATGGGCVCRVENYPLLHQNGTIFWLQRDLALLPKDGRPISQRSDLTALYAQRAPLYARFADAVIDNNGMPEETVHKILEVLA